ncbi:hypothetical protein A8F94_02310 [Bacillus sp. FJAT-27225]|uniref:DUF6376 family protein n=1 Tax=Bacillus sp. FJAT-27225 TaxID=1743144 RepID=UPI00080C2247|nr:DUF6376 family protein [Bacillus sp. FJAT-27225]OCA90730.1 hypothetical protein A8F94_02310 [Bacillus sp. FJAT-27225]
MNRKLTAIFLGLTLILSGCSFLEEANNTLSYANDAKDYVNKAIAFAEEVPAKAEKAMQDEQAVDELKQELETMKTEINEFSKLEAPRIASDLHNKIVEKNEQLEGKIDEYLKHIENGTLDETVLNHEELAKPIADIKNLVDQIKELGN